MKKFIPVGVILAGAFFTFIWWAVYGSIPTILSLAGWILAVVGVIVSLIHIDRTTAANELVAKARRENNVFCDNLLGQNKEQRSVINALLLDKAALIAHIQRQNDNIQPN